MRKGGSRGAQSLPRVHAGAGARAAPVQLLGEALRKVGKPLWHLGWGPHERARVQPQAHVVTSRPRALGATAIRLARERALQLRSALLRAPPLLGELQLGGARAACGGAQALDRMLARFDRAPAARLLRILRLRPRVRAASAPQPQVLRRRGTKLSRCSLRGKPQRQHLGSWLKGMLPYLESWHRGRHAQNAGCSRAPGPPPCREEGCEREGGDGGRHARGAQSLVWSRASAKHRCGTAWRGLRGKRRT